MTTFRALRVEQDNDGNFSSSVKSQSVDDLPDGDLLIEVRYSSLNYKDALSASGAPGVTRNYPHTPGIDAAGVVQQSSSDDFAVGDEVVVIGFDLGMDTPGGYGELIRVPAGWAIPRPPSLTLRNSMILGTAGFTAALCVHKLEGAGMSPDSGPVLVTGSTGGVGSIAVSLLSKLGYEVHALTGKADQHEFLHKRGATHVVPRSDLEEESRRPLGRESWGGVVDTVGGPILVNALKSLRYGCSLAACGLTNSPQISATVFPFILRHVNLLGIDSVELPIEQKQEIWTKLATDWSIGDLDSLVEPLTLDSLPQAIDRILGGQMVGRGLVEVSSSG